MDFDPRTSSNIAAAEAMAVIIVDPANVQPAQTLHIALDEPTPELAFMTWPNAILDEARFRLVA